MVLYTSTYFYNLHLFLWRLWEQKFVKPVLKKITSKFSSFIFADEAGSSKRKNKIVPTGAKEIEDPAFKKSKSTYSVAKDDNASSVYKSLFTSSDKAKSQTRAHWITYNPFYNWAEEVNLGFPIVNSLQLCIVKSTLWLCANEHR
jgi:hypothetical protein